MTKKFFLIFVILFAAAGFMSAQQETEERAKNNISLSFGVFGAELSYERMFSGRFSVLADVSYTTMVFIDEFTASAKGRWYPFSRAFYLDLGLGYSYGKGVTGLMADMVLTIFTFGWYAKANNFESQFRGGGFLVQPGLGWKFDVGEPDGFVLPLSMALDIKLGGEVPDLMPCLRFGLGYSF